MITICMYCEVEDPDKFSEPFCFTFLVTMANHWSSKRGSRQKHFY